MGNIYRGGSVAEGSEALPLREKITKTKRSQLGPLASAIFSIYDNIQTLYEVYIFMMEDIVLILKALIKQCSLALEKQVSKLKAQWYKKGKKTRFNLRNFNHIATVSACS